ncbi:hypothetical protein RhiirA4_483493 [Rhizophagus irregularis]|uniref:Uncharacterized protein n=1 Tax=Rhizophagus irregularis TaxID=588596 RepID=A0A2I1HMR1_9GLOM|nr:hypothetical protein RhiirA4_483493 [Rhizophagus irregularis]
MLLIETVIFIKGIVILPLYIGDWIVPFSVTLISGIYTIIDKTLPSLLAFCVVNISPTISIIVDISDRSNKDLRVYLSTLERKRDANIKILERFEAEFLNLTKNKNETEIEEIYNKLFITPSIIVKNIMISLNVLFLILSIIIWKKNYWNSMSNINIPIPGRLKKDYYYFKRIISERDEIIMGSIGIYPFIAIIPLFILTFNSKIVKKGFEIKTVFIIIALSGQATFCVLDVKTLELYSHLQYDQIILLTFLCLLFINIILYFIFSDRGKRKKLEIYLTYDSDLVKDYKYSNDLNDDDDDDNNDYLNTYDNLFVYQRPENSSIDERVQILETLSKIII